MKGLMEYPALKGWADDLGPGRYDFYRCYKCSRIITREEEKLWYEQADMVLDDQTMFCYCGSLRITPARPPRGLIGWWRLRKDFVTYTVLRYTVKVILARGLAPWLDKHFRAALPLIEYVVSPKEA
jgi:hypothetical protein